MKTINFFMIVVGIAIALGACEYRDGNSTSQNILPVCYYELGYEIESGIGRLSNDVIVKRHESIVILEGKINMWNINTHKILDLTTLDGNTVYFPSICDQTTVQGFIDTEINQNNYNNFLSVRLQPSDKETYLIFYKNSEIGF